MSAKKRRKPKGPSAFAHRFQFPHSGLNIAKARLQIVPCERRRGLSVAKGVAGVAQAAGKLRCVHLRNLPKSRQHGFRVCIQKDLLLVVTSFWLLQPPAGDQFIKNQIPLEPNGSVRRSFSFEERSRIHSEDVFDDAKCVRAHQATPA
jgi:hypothetical protein